MRILSVATFWVPLCLSLFAGIAFGAEAQEGSKSFIDPSFSLRSAYWSQDTRYTTDQNYSVDSIWLTFRTAEIAGFKSYLDSYLQFENLTRNLNNTLVLREAYVDRSVGDFDFRLGRQILVWGRADKFNPTDYLSVRDYRRLFTDDEDQRNGIFSLAATYNFSSYRFKAVWLPEWISPGLPFPNLGPGLSWVDVVPSNPATQFGLKLDQSGGGSVDWSVSYFQGYSKVPDLLASPVAQGVNLQLIYPSVNVFGGDFAFALGEWGFRGESAYTLTPNASGANPFQQKPFLLTVLGVEKTLIEGLSVNLQYLNRWVQSYSDPTLITDPTTSLVAVQSAITSQQMAQLNHGVSLRPSYKFMNDTFEAEIVWIRWFVTNEQLVRPRVTYALTDKMKLIAGGQIYSGSSTSFFGRIQSTSAGFFEFRFNF